MSSGGGIGLRRNGKKQACEVCRKAKLACDHSLPHCGRCVRRKLTAKCIYHPAPMTRPRGAIVASLGSAQHTPTTSGGSSHDLSSPQSLGQESPTQQIIDPLTSAINKATDGPLLGSDDATRNNPLHRHMYWDKNATFQRSARYYGPTSFSAIFRDANVSEDINISENSRKHPATWPFGQPLLGRNRPSAPTVRMDQVLKALTNIPSKEICFKLLAMYNPLVHHSMLDEIIMRHCIETLWSTFGAELAEPRTSEKLSVIANVCFKSEERPLPPAPENGYAWIDGFMGLNLRFEMLGLLFGFFGYSYQCLQEHDELFKVPENDGRDRKQTTWRMKECAEVCFRMCEMSEEINEISLALMMCIAVLETVCIGDESFQTRRQIGDIVVYAIAAGLHRMSDYGPNNKMTPATEYKRRLWSAIYCADKNHAAFNGTPPALSARYCVVRLPLDLPENYLAMSSEEMSKAVDKLDVNGWNTESRIYRTTFFRAFSLIVDIREQILEASLGVDALVPASRIDDLHRLCQETYANFPNQLRYSPREESTSPNDAGHLMVQAYLYLSLLQNSFLIDRVAIARGFQNGQRLLDTAVEMMDITTMFWRKRDQLMIYTSLFDWIITCYGIPCAGVVCVELLKQANGQSELVLPRSSAIQKLTIFIAFLEWIRPTDGNFMLAGRLKKVLQRILDRVLDPPKEVAGNSDVVELPFDPMFEPFGEMDWLNTIDWTQGSWIE